MRKVAEERCKFNDDIDLDNPIEIHEISNIFWYCIAGCNIDVHREVMVATIEARNFVKRGTN